MQAPDRFHAHWTTMDQDLKTLAMDPDPHVLPCLIPDPSLIATMDSKAKCYELLPFKCKSTLTGPSDGVTAAFVGRCIMEIPTNIMEAMALFARVLALGDYSNFVVPSTDVSLIHDQSTSRIVTSLCSEVDTLLPDVEPEERGTLISPQRVIQSLRDVLPESMKVPVPVVRMRLGFTGAVFKVGAETKRMVFCVLFVTPASNFTMWECMYDTILKQPRPKAHNYDERYGEFLEADALYNRVMQHEICVNLGLTDTRFGRHDMYKLDPAGYLGTTSVTDVFMVPFKIMHNILREYPSATDIVIAGSPRGMSFANNDPDTMAWTGYKTAYIKSTQGVASDVRGKLDEFNKTTAKTRDAFEPVQIRCAGGWPLQVTDGGRVSLFGLPWLPIMHSVDVTRVPCSSKTWYTNVGGADGIPEVTKGLLRTFLTSSARLDVTANIDHYLCDRRLADPSIVLQKYWSSEANPLGPLLTDGKLQHWYTALCKDIAARRQADGSVSEIHASLIEYLNGGVRTLVSMIHSGGFHSAVIKQALALAEKADPVAAYSGGPKSVSQTIANHARANLSSQRSFDPYYRTMHAYWHQWGVLNKDIRCSHSNLKFVVSVFDTFGMHFSGVNSSWTRFFATIIIRAGYGHFEYTDKTGAIWKDYRKPNTTGFNYCESRIDQILALLYRFYGSDMDRGVQALSDSTRWTPTFWESATSANVGSGQVLSVPNEQQTWRKVIVSEARDKRWMDAIIHAIPRGEQAAVNCAMNTWDPQKNGLRETFVKHVVCFARLIALATNCNFGPEETEQGKSLGVVTHVMVPGSGKGSTKRRGEHSMMSFETNGTSMQHSEISDAEAACNFIPLTNTVWQIGMLLNRLGVVPIEINSVVLSVYEWFCVYIQNMLSGAMDNHIQESFSRICQGYKSRAVAHSTLLHTTLKLAETASLEDALREAALMNMFNALPLPGIYHALHSVLCRAVSMPSLLIFSIAAAEFDVPILSVEELCEFFDGEGVPAGRDQLRVFNKVKAFVQSCISLGMLCPEEPGQVSPLSNACFYVTSPGAPDMKVSDPQRAVFRVKGFKAGLPEADTIFWEAAKTIKRMFGNDLLKVCHFGPEESIYKNGIVAACKFSFDARNIFGPNAYYGRKHLQRLGLLDMMPCALDYDELDPPPLAKHFVFTAGDGEEIRSGAVGFHMWGMLAIGAMTGFAHNPHVSDTFARNFLRVLVSNAPPGCLPGNTCNLPSFSAEGAVPEYLVVSEKDRPEHFFRPPDMGFVNTGVVVMCPPAGNFAPEDLIPQCPELATVAEFYKVEPLFVRSFMMPTVPQLCPNRPYSFHVPMTGISGFVMVDSRRSVVGFHEFRGKEAQPVVEKPYDQWAGYLKEQGYVMTPMIYRAGACVAVKATENGEEQVGCVVLPYVDDDGDECQEFRFNMTNATYSLSFLNENTIGQLPFLVTLRKLKPLGTVLYLSMDIMPERAWVRRGKFLRVRLTVPDVRQPPDGVIYVSFKLSPLIAGPNRSTLVTRPFKPWELQFAAPPDLVLDMVV